MKNWTLICKKSHLCKKVWKKLMCCWSLGYPNMMWNSFNGFFLNYMQYTRQPPTLQKQQQTSLLPSWEVTSRRTSHFSFCSWRQSSFSSFQLSTCSLPTGCQLFWGTHGQLWWWSRESLRGRTCRCRLVTIWLFWNFIIVFHLQTIFLAMTFPSMRAWERVPTNKSSN